MEFRDRSTGFHSNDIESGNGRLKGWSRHRYGRLQLSEPDLHEYAFYVNRGTSFVEVMDALGRCGTCLLVCRLIGGVVLLVVSQVHCLRPAVAFDVTRTSLEIWYAD